jgi:hypothetical protein
VRHTIPNTRSPVVDIYVEQFCTDEEREIVDADTDEHFVPCSVHRLVGFSVYLGRESVSSVRVEILGSVLTLDAIIELA